MSQKNSKTSIEEMLKTCDLSKIERLLLLSRSPEQKKMSQSKFLASLTKNQIVIQNNERKRINEKESDQEKETERRKRKRNKKIKKNTKTKNKKKILDDEKMELTSKNLCHDALVQKACLDRLKKKLFSQFSELFFDNSHIYGSFRLDKLNKKRKRYWTTPDCEVIFKGTRHIINTLCDHPII